MSYKKNKPRVRTRAVAEDKRDNFSTSLFVADFYEALPRTENSGSMGLSDNKLQNLVNDKSKNTTQFVIRDVENNKNKIINRTE